MARRPCVIDLSRLHELAEAGFLYQFWTFGNATAIVPWVAVFGSGNSKGLDVHLLSIRACTTIQGTFSVATTASDPAIATKNGGINLRLGQAASQAFVEVTAVAAPTVQSGLFGTDLLAHTQIEVLQPTPLFMPPGSFVFIQSSIAVQTVDYIFLWAEIPQSYELNYAEE